MATIGTDIDLAVSLLKQGKLVSIPTDTVYGLACVASDHEALENIFIVKKRDKNKAILAQVHSESNLKNLAEHVPKLAKKYAQEYWPGALTLVLNANEQVSPLMKTEGTIGIRVPNHKMTLELLQTINAPLAVTSANISGQISPTTALEVNQQIGDQIAYILDGGDCAEGVESTIIGFEKNKPVIYREGVISANEIHGFIED